MNWIKRKLLDWIMRCPPFPREAGQATMSEDEMRLALGISQAHPVWRAVQQLLREEIESAVSQVGAPPLAAHHGALAHTAGGVEWLRALQFKLEAAREKANRVQDPEKRKR